jgi:hypothetical protein
VRETRPKILTGRGWCAGVESVKGLLANDDECARIQRTVYLVSSKDSVDVFGISLMWALGD